MADFRPSCTSPGRNSARAHWDRDRADVTLESVRDSLVERLPDVAFVQRREWWAMPPTSTSWTASLMQSGQSYALIKPLGALQKPTIFARTPHLGVWQPR